MPLTQIALGKFTLFGVFLLTSSLPVWAQQDNGPLKDRMEALATKLCEQNQVPGVAIAVIRNREHVWSLGIGVADTKSKMPVTDETVFNVGSVSKTISAWGFMKLVEQGKVRLDAPIEDYLKSWKLPESEFDNRKVTLERILSHTAGLSLHGYPGFAPGRKLPTLRESLNGATNGRGDVRIQIKPGTRFQYSGGGYTIAQLMLEDSTGEKFADHMRANILAPLKMNQSEFGWHERLDRVSASPHDKNGIRLEREHFTALAAAGLQTTARDLARFVVASMGGNKGQTKERKEILPASTIRRMLRPVSLKLRGRPSGLGYQTMKFGPVEVVGHAGTNTGWEAAMFMRPDSGDGIVLLSNGANGQKVLRPVMMTWLKSVTDK